MCSKDSLHVDTISMLYLNKLYSNDFKSLSLRNVQPCSLKADRLSNKNITYLLQFLSWVIFTQKRLCVWVHQLIVWASILIGILDILVL